MTPFILLSAKLPHSSNYRHIPAPLCGRTCVFALSIPKDSMAKFIGTAGDFMKEKALNRRVNAIVRFPCSVQRTGWVARDNFEVDYSGWGGS